MRSRAKTVAIAIGIGIVVTAILEAASYWVDSLGSEWLARTLGWPNSLLQALVPCNNIGTAERPLCEGTPLNLLAYFLSFPVAIAVYSFVAYVLVRRRGS
jgi:hypothetical protein